MRKRIVVFAWLLSFALIGSVLPAAAADPEVLADYPVPNGRFFSQASGKGPSVGYTITDDGGQSFFSEFLRLGAMDALGYPASRRFDQGGFTTQATQRFLLQWRPELGHVVFGNAFDVLSAAGRDDWLRRERMIPPPGDNAPDRGLSWDQVVARHLAILDQNAALKAAYNSAPEPVNFFGLPQSYADMGPAFVLRCQRAAFQLWKIRTPFARPGDITVVNGGDLVKEAGLLPPDATTPEATTSLLVAPPGNTIHPSVEALAAVRQIAQTGRNSTVEVVAPVRQGESRGTGIVLDSTHVLTNNHVVEGSNQVSVVLPDGRSVPATAVARDQIADLAVVTAALPAGAVQAAQVGDSRALQSGEFVVAIGYTPFFPTPPTTRIGVFGGRDPDAADQLRTDTFILPGDSGGPLFDLRGRVVGVNTAIQIDRRGAQPLTGFSIDLAAAAPLVNDLVANGRVTRPFLGVQTVSVTPLIAARFGLPVQSGAAVAAVVDGSPAAAAGILPGDVIVGLDADPVRSTRDLANLLARHRVGDQVAVTVVGDAGRRSLRATLGPSPA